MTADYVTHTEADALRFERRFGPDYPDDRPTLAELQRDETDPPEFDDDPDPDPDAGYAATALVLLVCIFGSLLFLAAVTVGQHVMCKAHHGSLRYCAAQSSSGAR